MVILRSKLGSTKLIFCSRLFGPQDTQTRWATTLHLALRVGSLPKTSINRVLKQGLPTARLPADRDGVLSAIQSARRLHRGKLGHSR